MSYRIEYGSNVKWETKKEEWGIRRVLIICVSFAIFLLAVNYFWNEGREVLYKLLLPGDAITTWNSIEQLAENLHQGIPLRFAAREFCYEIMQSGY